jgi:hypothetical protein
MHPDAGHLNQIEIGHLADGIYLIRIEHDGKKMSQSFIKK